MELLDIFWNMFPIIYLPVMWLCECTITLILSPNVNVEPFLFRDNLCLDDFATGSTVDILRSLWNFDWIYFRWVLDPYKCRRGLSCYWVGSVDSTDLPCQEEAVSTYESNHIWSKVNRDTSRGFCRPSRMGLESDRWLRKLVFFFN